MNKQVKEIFKGAEEMIETALELEIASSVEIYRNVFVKDKAYVFSVKLRPIEEKRRR